MINRKTKDVGMPYNYNGKEYLIEHDLFRLNNFKVIDKDNGTFVMMALQNTLFDVQVTPFYDPKIELEEGMVLNVAYVNVDGDLRIHGYEVSEDINRNANLVSMLSEPKKRMFEGQSVDKDKLIRMFNYYLGMMTDTALQSLVANTYRGSFNHICTWPAAVTVHHNIPGGLLLHSVNVTRQAIDIAKNYSDIDLNLVIAGALLHDIGKLVEYTEDGKISDVGKYRDHITLSQSMIEEVIKIHNINIDDRTLNRLIHIILSHHGKLEWGSTKVPSTKEALIVHLADYIDTQMYIIHEVYRKISCGDTEYSKLLGTFIVNENIEISQNYDI